MKKQEYGYRILAEDIKVSNDTQETRLNNNDLVVGGSGSGKTSGYISTNLGAPNGSYIVSDTKGLLYDQHAERLKEQGYEVKLLDFVHPEKSMGYNPLSYIRKKEDGSYYEQDILKLTTLMAPSQDKREPYWDNGARRYISTLIGYVLESDEYVDPNLKDVVDVHTNHLSNMEDSYLSNWLLDHPDSFTARQYASIKQLEKSEKTFACIVDFASESIQRFAVAEYAPVFQKSDEMELASLGHKKSIIFLNVSDHDASFHIFCNLFNMQAMQTLMEEASKNENGRLNVPVRIIFDDFAAGPMIDDFDNVIATIRSRDISVSVVIQNISQLYDKYSEYTAQTIISNCDHILILRAGDPMTAQFFMDYVDRPASVLMNKSEDECILVSRGSKPVFAKKLKPYGLILDEDEVYGDVSEVSK